MIREYELSSDQMGLAIESERYVAVYDTISDCNTCSRCAFVGSGKSGCSFIEEMNRRPACHRSDRNDERGVYWVIREIPRPIKVHKKLPKQSQEEIEILSQIL